MLEGRAVMDAGASAASTADRLLEVLVVDNEPCAVAVGVVSDDVAIRTEGCATSDRFEIGSLTKTMTGIVLAELVLEGVVGLDDRIAGWIDAGPNGDISLRQLATHTAGLPRLAPNARDGTHYEVSDPYAAFTAEMAEEGARVASRTKGEAVSYSNFGFQLLGLAVERAAATGFGQLLDEYIFETAQMRTAAIGTADAVRVQGHDHRWRRPSWSFVPSVSGFGGVIGSIDDMTAYVTNVIAGCRSTRTTAVSLRHPRT